MNLKKVIATRDVKAILPMPLTQETVTIKISAGTAYYIDKDSLITKTLSGNAKEDWVNVYTFTKEFFGLLPLDCFREIPEEKKQETTAPRIIKSAYFQTPVNAHYKSIEKNTRYILTGWIYDCLDENYKWIALTSFDGAEYKASNDGEGLVEVKTGYFVHRRDIIKGIESGTLVVKSYIIYQ